MTTETTTEPSSEDVSGLKNKNADLKRERDEWKRKADAAQKLLDEAEDNAAAGDELAKLQREYNKLEKALNEMTGERDTLAADLRTTRVDGAISAAIASGNVRPEMVEAVEAILHRKAQYEDGAATIDGKSIADFAKAYFAKDGAHFVRAADNAGADANGNNGAKSVDYANKPFALGEYQQMLQTNPEAAAAWADATGNGFLNG
ncbi:kinesin [Sphingobium sp. PAMC28499]|uniref:kinesin n=1 Tax=Sphingobium sp. PAMC28499 TaxID=2565554 RepID=UPI00109DA3F9|nr:kinesin [Sphingobium sp. PAMC28499]QCB39197.1 kinesin [Sphingobium sp. PAMC28499]